MTTPEQVEAVARDMFNASQFGRLNGGWDKAGVLTKQDVHAQATAAIAAYEGTRPAVSADDGVEEAIYDAVAMYSEEEYRDLTWAEVRDTSAFWVVDGAFSARFIRVLARAVRDRLGGKP